MADINYEYEKTKKKQMLYGKDRKMHLAIALQL